MPGLEFRFKDKWEKRGNIVLHDTFHGIHDIIHARRARLFQDRREGQVTILSRDRDGQGIEVVERAFDGHLNDLP